MSYTIRMFIEDKYLSETRYKEFLQECCKIEGFYNLTETIPFNYPSKNEIHMGFLKYEDLDEPLFVEFENGEPIEREAVDRILIYDLILKANIYYQEFDLISKNYNLYLSVSSSVSHTPYKLFVQLFIPYVAFSVFQDIIIFDPSLEVQERSKYFFNKLDYLSHIKQTLLSYYGENIFIAKPYLYILNNC